MTQRRKKANSGVVGWLGLVCLFLIDMYAMYVQITKLNHIDTAMGSLLLLVGYIWSW